MDPTQYAAIKSIGDSGKARVMMFANGQPAHAPMNAVTAASVHNATAKATPVDADEFGYYDSVSAGPVKATWANIKAAIWSALGTLIAGGTTKTTPADGDLLAIADSAASNATKSLSWANARATLFTAPTFTTSMTGPLLIGGTGASSSLSLKSTSGVGTADYINFLVGNNGATEAMRVDTAGRVLIGSTVAYATIASLVTQFQSHATSASGAFGFFNWGNALGGGTIALNKSRSGVVGTRGIVLSGDTLGVVFAAGDDGTNFIEGAEIRFLSDAAPAANSMPGRIQLSTTPSGSTTPTERIRIDSNGFASVLGGSFGRGAPVTKTADFTVAATENNLINNKSGATCTVTLPAASSFSGREILIKTIQAQTVVSASSNVVPAAGGAAGTAILAATAGKWAILVSDGTNWIIMAAN